jgi:hypothetical protein
MAFSCGREIQGFLLAAAIGLSAIPLAAQDRFLRLDDGLYELNADGTYHKVQGSTANAPRPQSSPSRPAASSSSSGQFTGQERFMRFDDGLYERMADGTYTKVDDRRLTQSQSQPGRYGASSTSTDPAWQRQFGRQNQWDNESEQWFDDQPQQWSNNGRPQQWSDNGRPQQWSNNGRPQQWSNNGRPQQWSNNGRPQQWNNNQPQEELRQLGTFLNALGGAVQNGGGGRPPRPNFQPQPNGFQAQPNFQPHPVPQPQPQPAPQPSPRPPAVDQRLQQGGNQSGFKLDE